METMTLYSKIIFLSLSLCLMLGLRGQGYAQPSDVQSLDRLRKLDSLANPVPDVSGKFMTFETKIIDAGKIQEDGSPVKFRFVWTNQGDSPLTVMRVTTGCSCARPHFEMKKVAKGETSVIEVTYYPKGHPGDFSRKFSVFTDLSETKPAAVLELRGYVEPASLPIWDYPETMGSLLLKRKEVKISSDVVCTERILCLNAGDKPLTITAEQALLPACLEVWCEPAVIMPAQEADLVVRFRPSKDGPVLPRVVPVIINGLDLAPSKRTIRVLFK